MYQGEIWIITVGGYDIYGKAQSSSELWNPISNNGWNEGSE